MLVNDIGVYVTQTGDIAYVTKTDGYRRCYGYMRDNPVIEMSWYTEDGSVRSGDVCGPTYDNELIVRAKIDLPENAHEHGEKVRNDFRKEFYKRCQERCERMG